MEFATAIRRLSAISQEARLEVFRLLVKAGPSGMAAGDIARKLGVAPATLAVAWVAAHPAVTAPLLGARNVTQLQAALAAADLKLSAESYAELSALTPAPPPATDRTDDGTEADLWKR